MNDQIDPTSDSGTVPVFSSTLAGVHILAVDDTYDALELLATLLELYGATVSAAASASEARALYLRRRPDAIVSDIGMPDEDGIDLIKSIRAIERERQSAPTPAVALTGFTNRLREASIEAGFQEHLAKPVEPERLVAALVRVLRGAASAG